MTTSLNDATRIVTPEEVGGGFVHLDGELYYRIPAFHRLPPFLINLPSPTDLWMFIASSGGLTAGRSDPDGALFPYETVDRLFDAHHHTGPITLIRVLRPGSRDILWEPFAEATADDPEIERNLYKNAVGNRLVFEEIHHGLSLLFRYGWSMADGFGLVRTARLENRGRTWTSVAVLDGLRNVLPFGAPLRLYQQSSSLVDAYKRAEYDPESGLAIYSLTARVSDRPEPAEELRAATVFCHGLPAMKVSLSLEAIRGFRRREPAADELLLTGRRGNYLAIAPIELGPGERRTWRLAADTGRNAVHVAGLRRRLLEGGDMESEIEARLEEAEESLVALVAGADGLQATASREEDVHHFANVLFNIMRGGVFPENYTFPRRDFADLLEARNHEVFRRHRPLLEALPDRADIQDLLPAVRATRDPDLERLALEYLPLYFGRRHGDPSRPWNRFSIRVRDEAGERLLNHEGNWRDIFQNWEALALSYPDFLPGMVARFVNASTVDGFNPYQLEKSGIDWEVPDPDDPWSQIGYWGDHQIVYLLRLLDAMGRSLPGSIESMLDREIFSSADVPYRLTTYAEMIANPRATLVFDREKAARIAGRVRKTGSDGKLVHDASGRVVHVNLLEKLLVPALSKLSNLVPDAGIWMNTQRPEWNDANNALVGNGCSMVTLCHLRRYLEFLGRLVVETGSGGTGDRAGVAESIHAARRFSVSTPVAQWLRQMESILAEKWGILSSDLVSDRDRRDFLDAGASSFEAYRASVYANGPTGRTKITAREVVSLCRSALFYLDHAISANRRDDGLYHAYNLIVFSEAGISIGRLYEMLEGQVAVLSSGALSAAEAGEVLASLFTSRLYDPGRKSFLLYPARKLPGYLEKNRISGEIVRSVPLFLDLVATGETSIVEEDVEGVFRFNSRMSHLRDLSAALDRLASRPEWTARVERDREGVIGAWESTFHHRAFTGRSGTMYAYEGLGCIYWHMVAKLLVAVQEIVVEADRRGEPACIVESLVEYYERIRAGLGFNRTVSQFGAFPTDPYSHTPAGRGAQQPGMTGQVKEEILTRFGELGVTLDQGRISFRPVRLRPGEFRRKPGTFRYVDSNGERQSIELPAGRLAFTYGQVPVIYCRSGGSAEIRLHKSDGTLRVVPGWTLDAQDSRAILGRSGKITRLEVNLPEG